MGDKSDKRLSEARLSSSGRPAATASEQPQPQDRARIHRVSLVSGHGFPLRSVRSARGPALLGAAKEGQAIVLVWGAWHADRNGFRLFSRFVVAVRRGDDSSMPVS